MADNTTVRVSNARRIALHALRYGAMLFGVGVIVQFYLAGVGIFAATGPLQHAASLDPHRLLGNILAVLALLVLIAAIIARPSTRTLVATIAMFVLTGVEGTIASAGGGAPYVGAIHPVFAAVILGLAVVIPLWARDGFGTPGEGTAAESESRATSEVGEESGV